MRGVFECSVCWWVDWRAAAVTVCVVVVVVVVVFVVVFVVLLFLLLFVVRCSLLCVAAAVVVIVVVVLVVGCVRGWGAVSRPRVETRAARVPDNAGAAICARLHYSP